MFGYVLPRKDKLSETQQKRYKAAYCGLCRSLGESYGFKARFLVNYDMVFLYFLLRTGKGQETQKCFCPAHPFCKKECLRRDGIMDYAADLTVLLSYWKLLDAKQDGGFFQKIPASLALLLYRKSYRKAARHQEEANRVFERELSRLQKLEKGNCSSIDRTADAFAKLLKTCAKGENEPVLRTRELLLYHIGRYLYLVDALEDLPKDLKRGRYNPLKYRYCLKDGNLSREDKEQLVNTIDASISMAASAFELLPSGDDREILENIIYYGLPAALQSVAKGEFRKRGKRA